MQNKSTLFCEGHHFIHLFMCLRSKETNRQITNKVEGPFIEACSKVDVTFTSCDMGCIPSLLPGEPTEQYRLKINTTASTCNVLTAQYDFFCCQYYMYVPQYVYYPHGKGESSTLLYFAFSSTVCLACFCFCVDLALRLSFDRMTGHRPGILMNTPNVSVFSSAC